MNNKLRLGLILDPEFYILEKSVSAVTLPLIRALTKTFDTRIIHDQDTYNRLCTKVDFLVSFEPKWAAPLLAWKRAGLLHHSLPDCPCYVMMSDPHNNSWRESYFLKQGLDFILALYDHPTRHHFTRIPPRQIVHFPWAIPEEWISSEPIRYLGQKEIRIFGAAQGDAYTVRNWCRQQSGVRSYEYSGVEYKALTDQGFFDWLKGLDAAIAAGSEDPKYRLTTPKYFEIAAAGCLLFAQETDDLFSVGFEDNKTCIVFSKHNFNEKARHYLSDPGNPSWLEIRQAGRDMIRSRHTIQDRLAGLETHVRRWQGRR
jgi:hypothetical protein